MERARRATSTARRVKMRIDPASGRADPPVARQEDPADPGSARHEVRQAHQNPERAADEVLGPADVPRRARPPARRIRHASRSALSAGDLPRPLPARGLGLARDAARPEAAAGRRGQHREVLPERPRGGALHEVRLRPHAAGLRLRVLQGMDRAGLPARDHGHDPAREPVLRRLLRRELGEPRPVRRRDHLRADPVHREDVPRHSARGRARSTAARPAAGKRWRRRCSTPTTTTAPGRTAPTRSTSAATPSSTSTTDKNAYYSEGPFRRTPRPGERDYLGQTRVDDRAEPISRSSCSARSRDRADSGTSGRRCSRRSAPTAIPKRIWDKRTGAIDREVAHYWRDHYDLVHIMQRDWATLGPKLRGKITLNVGLSDNFFLNNAVYRAEEFLKSANPPADARSRLRAARRALLERRSRPRQRRLAAHLQLAIYPADGGAVAEERAIRRGRHFVAVLRLCSQVAECRDRRGRREASNQSTQRVSLTSMQS